MFQEISYALIFGKPVIMYLGIATLLSFLVTASIAVMNLRGIRIIRFVWHPRMAAFSICLAIIHGALGVLLYF